MLQTISWQQYLTAVITITIIWYLFVGFKFYRAEILQFLKIRSPAAGLQSQIVPSPAKSVMGKVRPDEHSGSTDAGELQFSTAEPDDISDETIPRGPTDVLTDEGRQLIDAASAMDKPVLISLLHTLFEKFFVFGDEVDFDKIVADLSDYAADRLPFNLSPDEWPHGRP